MTKQRIEQYISLKREINMLEEQIQSAKSGGDYVSDTVQGSELNPPYAKRTIVIKGYGSQDIPIIEARRAWCVAECHAIEQFIAKTDDSTMRQLLTRKFIEGHNIAETAILIGYSESHTKRLLKGFLKR